MNNMSLRSFRILIGTVILATHFACIAIVCYFTVGVYEVPEIITFISAVAPITGLYGYTYYRYITFAVIKLSSEAGREISPASWITQTVVVGVFCVAIMAAPVWFFTAGTESDLSSTLAVVETIFGMYVARSFSVLFPVEVLGESQSDD